MMRIGMNTLSLTREMNEDFAGVARVLKETGVAYLEVMSDWGASTETIEFYASMIGGRSGWDPDGQRKRTALLRELGMEVRGMYVQEELLEEQIPEMVDFCRELGVSYVVLSFFGYGSDLESVGEKIALVKRAGRRLSAGGVQLLVHTHDNDFLPLKDHDGVEKPLIQMFLEQCSREEMQLELDTGWAHYAGMPVAEFVEKYADRIAILHLKDIHKDYREMDHNEVSVPCGSGVVDFPGILSTVPKQYRDTIGYVLDQDPSGRDILKDHAASVRYLKGIKEGLE